MTQQTPEQPEPLEPFDGEAYQDAKHAEDMIAQGERERIIRKGLEPLNVGVEQVMEDGTHIDVQGVSGEPDEFSIDVHSRREQG